MDDTKCVNKDSQIEGRSIMKAVSKEKNLTKQRNGWHDWKRINVLEIYIIFVNAGYSEVCKVYKVAVKIPVRKRTEKGG